MHTKPAANTPLAESGIETAAQEFEDFIYLISHDVRNSVRALIELPQWIEEDLEAQGVKMRGSLEENIALMNVHTRRLDRMLIDLLIYSRIGRMQSNELLEWEGVADAVLDQVKVPDSFRVVRDFRAPQFNMGSTDALTLVASLLSNAIKHHDRDEGVVQLETYERDGRHVFTIRDDGPGIPEAHREKAFEVMTTLRPRDEIEGSGMGLANVRKIVKLYGGSIQWLSENSERGCHLAISFPCARRSLH
jgi:signal transduction histidine kinase